MCGCLAQREMFRMKRLFSLSWNKQDSPLCLYYNHNACHCFPVPEPLALLHLCTYVCVVFYNLDWPAVGRSSAHIKYLAFAAGWSGTRCKVLCGSSAFLKASSRSRGFWESSLFLEIQTKSWVQVGGLCVCACVYIWLLHAYVLERAGQTAAGIEEGLLVWHVGSKEPHNTSPECIRIGTLTQYNETEIGQSFKNINKDRPPHENLYMCFL